MEQRIRRGSKTAIANCVVFVVLMTVPAYASSASAQVTDDIDIRIERNGSRVRLDASQGSAKITKGFASPGGIAAKPEQTEQRSGGWSKAVSVPQPICTNQVGGLDFVLSTPPPPEMVDPYLVNRVCKLNGVAVQQGSGVFWADRLAPAGAAAAAGAPAPVEVPAVTEIDIRRYVDEFLVPDLVIRHNPEGHALTGIETWFWVEGWDGAPVIETVDVLGVAVLVELRLAAVQWDFGDGATEQTTDLGRAYPDKAGTTHVYTTRSTIAGENATFAATSTVTIEVAASVGGNPLVPLQPFTETYAVDVLVREAQALLE